MRTYVTFARIRFHVQGHGQGSKVNLRGLQGHLLYTVKFLVYIFFETQGASKMKLVLLLLLKVYPFYLKLMQALVSQWVKRWPTDLAGVSLSPARGEIFSTVDLVLLHTAFHYQPLIVLIWLKYWWKGRKIARHPSILKLISEFRL